MLLFCLLLDDPGAALLAQELLDVVRPKTALAGAAARFPAAERLAARPRAGSRAAAPVRVNDAGFDAIEELVDLALVFAEDAGSQAISVSFDS